MSRKIFSEKLDLIYKSREAMLSAVQIYNNPLISFKSESFIVLSLIAWTYLLHAYYRSKKIDYRYFDLNGKRKRFHKNTDGTIRYWDLKECLSRNTCPLAKDVVNNLEFLIGLRNQIEHKKATGLDSYLSARYQACALNFNYYLKKLHGEKHSLDKILSVSLQFAELNYSQSQVIKNNKNLISKEIISYISNFDGNLSEHEIKSDQFAYRLIFTKVLAKRQGQADRVIEFIDPNSDIAKSISKEYWIKDETEKRKFSATQVIQKIQKSGFPNFKMHQHTLFWKEHDGKEQSKGFGVMIVSTWYWYDKWISYVIDELNKVN